MQRRLTDQEESILDDYVDAAQRLGLRGITVPYELGQQMLYEGTTDGLPYVEPPLTDEDAKTRPWVMVRDNDSLPWVGPLIFVAKCADDNHSYYVFSKGKSRLEYWDFARRATPAEIAAAGLEVTE